jgi:hypothetical protein
MRAREIFRGAAAGAAAAGAWAALEPLAARALSTGYTDVRLLGRLLRDGPGWRPAGVAMHVANGAAFGAVFAAAGRRGPAAGAGWAGAEVVLTWPMMAIADRIHPDRRSGRWPPLLTNRRVFAQEVGMHLLFGALLGITTARAPA